MVFIFPFYFFLFFSNLWFNKKESTLKVKTWQFAAK